MIHYDPQMMQSFLLGPAVSVQRHHCVHLIETLGVDDAGISGIWWGDQTVVTCIRVRKMQYANQSAPEVNSLTTVVCGPWCSQHHIMCDFTVLTKPVITWTAGGCSDIVWQQGEDLEGNGIFEGQKERGGWPRWPDEFYLLQWGLSRRGSTVTAPETPSLNLASLVCAKSY